MIPIFHHFGNSRLIFGPGSIAEIPSLITLKGPVFVVTGGHFPATKTWNALCSGLAGRDIELRQEVVSREPSPESVDDLTEEARRQGATTVIAIGGGSVLDAGKAVAAMLFHEGSVADYLEGVGTKEPKGRTAAMIAVPTTAGTGSEATKNAVISRHGPNGFKKSLRHDAFIPHTVVIDPELAIGCPPEVSRACGMDALCQLLESFISTGATPITDALAQDGIVHFARGSRLLRDMLYGGSDELALRSDLALAAYYSGLTLANAGLGTVHGLAGPLGAFSEIPHGVACGRLLGPVFRIMESKTSLEKLAAASRLLRSPSVAKMLDFFDSLSESLPRLGFYGLTESDLDDVVGASGNKNSPIPLDEAHRRRILTEIL